MPEQTLTNVNAPDVLVQPGMWMIGVDGVMGGPDRRVWQVLGDLGGVSADGDAFEAGVRARRAPGPSRSLSGRPSHHAVLATGDLVRRLEVMSSVLGLDVLKI